MKTLEPVVTIGDVDVAAIVEIEHFPPLRSPNKTSGTGRFLASGTASITKRPLAVILRIDGQIRAFASDGRSLSAEDFDADFPGLRAQFESETRH